jgi:hypothetical protein
MSKENLSNALYFVVGIGVGMGIAFGLIGCPILELGKLCR